MKRRLTLLVIVATVLAVWLWPRSPNSPEPEVELALEKQAWIWEIEQLTFQLEQKFGKEFIAAWKSRDADELRRMFRDQFTARFPAEEAYVARGAEWWSEVAFEPAGDDAAGPLLTDQRDAAETISLLLDWMDRFETIASTSFRVLALDRAGDGPRITSTDASKPREWEMRLLLGAYGVTAEGSPIALDAVLRVRATFAGEEEILQGALFDRWEAESIKFRTTARQLFTDATSSYGLDSLNLMDNWLLDPEEMHAYWTFIGAADYDGDGYLDLAICSATGHLKILRNVEGKRFEDVTRSLGLPVRRQIGRAYLAHWFDFDNDGDPDLLLGRSLYENVDGKRFVDVTAKVGLSFGMSVLGCAVADFDRDGWLDLYVLHDLGGYQVGQEKIGYLNDDITGAENQLWRNLGGTRFENVTEQAGVGNGRRHTFAASWFYADDDDWPDLYVVNDFGINALYINQRDGTFIDVAPMMGIADFATSMGCATGDLDGDGRMEIYVANMFSKMGRRIIGHVSEDDYPPGIFEQIQGACAGNRLYKLTPDGTTYQDLSERLAINQVGWAYGPVLADFDANGLLDAYATTGFISRDRTKPDG